MTNIIGVLGIFPPNMYEYMACFITTPCETHRLLAVRAVNLQLKSKEIHLIGKGNKER
jgi:hypothetical protein